MAKGGDVVAGGKILHHLNVGHQTRAGEDTLEQIVAEQGVFRHAALQGRLEGVDIIDALAGIRAFAKQVLIDVRHRRRVGIDAAGVRKHVQKERALASDRQRR